MSHDYPLSRLWLPETLVQRPTYGQFMLNYANHLAQLCVVMKNNLHWCHILKIVLWVCFTSCCFWLWTV